MTQLIYAVGHWVDACGLPDKPCRWRGDDCVRDHPAAKQFAVAYYTEKEGTATTHILRLEKRQEQGRGRSDAAPIDCLVFEVAQGRPLFTPPELAAFKINGLKAVREMRKAAAKEAKEAARVAARLAAKALKPRAGRRRRVE